MSSSSDDEAPSQLAQLLQSGPSVASSSGSSRHSNLSEKERNWVFYCLAKARGLEITDDDDLSTEVTNRAQQLMRPRMDRVPSRAAIITLWRTYMSTGSVTKKQKGGRPKKAGREEAEYLLKSTDDSTRGIARAIGTVSHVYVHRVAKEQKMRFYRAIRAQKLTAEHIMARLSFAMEMHRKLGLKQIDLNNVCFTDECTIGCGDSGNRQNEGLWRCRGEFGYNDLLREVQVQGQKLHLFVLVHCKAKVIGPYFPTEEELPTDTPATKRTMTADRYIAMLKNKVIPELKRRLGDEDFAKCVWQQDGAAIHTAAKTIDYLKSVFGDRLIAKGAAFEWPACSPDLNTLDYWFWSYMKSSIRKLDPQDLMDLKDAVKTACRQIDGDMLKRAIHDFDTRIKALIEAKGAHFEYTLKKFKSQMKESTTCTSCNETHLCDCPTCDDICVATILAQMDVD